MLVDRNDWRIYGGLRWYGGKYAYTQIDGKTVYLHRLILNTPAGLEVDHINGDSLDNRRKNLRVVTRSQNEMNKAKPAHNTSGYKGVSIYRATGKFSAYIEINQKKIHIGYFKTREEAAHVYNQFASQLFGEYAKINEIGPA